jgi:hypothetical protein
MAAGAAESEMRTARLGIYLAAITLLTYGRLDVVADVLENIPAGRHPARVLARSVQDLLPLATELDVLARPGAALAWVRENEARLRWSEAAGRFELT